MNLCELVRKEFDADRMLCLYPYRVHDGLAQACTISYNSVTTLDLRFFSDNYEFQVWTDLETNNIYYQPGNYQYDCFMMKRFAYHLIRHNKEAGLLLLYSLFYRVKRLIKKADAAYAADAKRNFRNALKALFKYRKEVMK